MRSAHFSACLVVTVWWSVSWSTPAAAQDPDPEPAPPETVTVRVISTPRRAQVEVLGRGEVGRTPIRRLELPVGEYDFIFTRPGYARSVVHARVSEDGQTIGTELQRAGRIAVRADHLPARGASIRVDGQLVGRVPATLEVAPGRRLVEVEADGYLTFGRWVEVEERGRETLNVRLEERPPDTGSILVSADVPEAEVEVDGEGRGQAPVIVEGLLPGEHLVVATAPDGTRVEQAVEVRANAREAVSLVLTPQPVPPGSIAIATEPAGATVLVDGEPRGQAPVTVGELSPGAHRVELSLDGYEPVERMVTVVGGETEELALTLEPGTPRPGRIVVTANREDAFVILDGLSRGRAPITLERIPPGTHAVRLSAEGMAPFETECVIRFGETCTVEAELVAAEVPVTVQARSGGALVDGAVLFVDGEERGALPWEGTLPPGRYAMEARADGYAPATASLELAVGADARTVSLAMERRPAPEPAVEGTLEDPSAASAEAPPAPSEDPTADAPPADGRFHARDAALPLPAGRGQIALFLGWPYLAGAEVAAGLPLPLDLGVAIRTFGRLTTLEVSSRLGWAPVDFFALGLRLRLAAGLGPDPGGGDASRTTVDTFGAKLDGVATLWPVDDLALSLWIGLDLTTDDYPFEERSAGAAIDGARRQNLARARLGGAVAYRFFEGWSMHARFEGILASSRDRRRILGDVLGLGNRDTEAYGELGVGYVW